jgi:signal transduction histidine kinase
MTPQDRQRALRLAAIFRELGRALVSSLDLHDLLGLILDRAIELLDADVAILRLLDRPGEHLRVEVARGVPEDAILEIRLHPGEGLAGQLLLDGAPLCGDDLQQDPRASQRDLARRLGWQSYAGVALHLHQQPIGVWFLIRKRRQPFTGQDLADLVALADLASAGIERTWLVQTIVRGRHESETLLRAAANGILVIDGRGRVVDLNPALERLTGWALREAHAQPCYEVIGCQRGPASPGSGLPTCPLKLASAGSERAFLEYRVRTREGQELPVEISYGTIRNEDGEIDRLIIVFRDLTHQKTIERLRSEFIANVSHELRTPLALIKGYATTLSSPQVTLDEARTHRFLENVSFAADRLGRMIDDLLWTSRLETDEMRLEPKEFDLGQMIDQVLAWFQPHAQGCYLASELPKESLHVWADPDRVEQVLVNLLTNAVKYSPPESTITIRSQVWQDPPRVVVHVSDEGIGIAAEHLPHLFDRFYLTENSDKGIGLGLPICRGLVEAMGGEIWVVSEVSKGSTFSFTLPVTADPGPTVATEAL